MRDPLLKAAGDCIREIANLGQKSIDSYRQEVIRLTEELAQLQEAIRKHRDFKGDDRCWMDDEDLYRTLPEGYEPPARNSSVELELCRNFISCRHNPATEYVSPQRRIEELEQANAHLTQRLAKIDGNDSHPEHRCRRCTGRNIVWFAESPLWNKVCRPEGEASEEFGILCPLCFAELAEQSGAVTSAWKLMPEDAQQLDAGRVKWRKGGKQGGISADVPEDRLGFLVDYEFNGKRRRCLSARFYRDDAPETYFTDCHSLSTIFVQWEWVVAYLPLSEFPLPESK